MAIPLPSAPPGGFMGGFAAANEITNQLLKNRGQQLENQYYAPSKESEIGYRNALMQGQNIENQYNPEKFRLANVFHQLQNQMYVPKTQAEINQSNALANKYNTMTPLEARELAIKNEFARAREQANIAQTQAQSEYYRMGGAGMGTGAKEEMNFRRAVALDNPQLKNDPNKVYEAANALRLGKTSLSDGTPLNPLSPAARESYNRIVKYGSTSPVITQSVRSNQAEAEIETLSNFAQEGLKPYGTTYFGKNPSQIMDSFRSDKKSQERLGKFIAAQQLQYEIAQNEIKLANGQPGVTSTQELMQLGQQMINTSYPKLSYDARNAAQKYFIEALKAGNEARKSVPIGASETRNQNKSVSDNIDLSKLSDAELKRIAGIS